MQICKYAKQYVNADEHVIYSSISAPPYSIFPDTVYNQMCITLCASLL